VEIVEDGSLDVVIVKEVTHVVRVPLHGRAMHRGLHRFGAADTDGIGVHVRVLCDRRGVPK